MMRNWWPRIVILVLLLIIVGLPVVLSQGKPGRAPGSDWLIIMSPHNEQIRYELSHAFNEYRRGRGEPEVYFDWRSTGGTSDQRKQILASFQVRADRGQEDQGIGLDLFFGGGAYDHGLVARGVTTQRHGETVQIPCTVPADIPDQLMAAVFPTDNIAGEPLYHPDRMWMGVVLSSFGIVYNQDVLHNVLKMDNPTTWADLVDQSGGRLRNWIALADPAHSGSIKVTYDTILQRMGWTEGWGLLRRVFANARYFTASSSKVPVDVSSGEAAAGMCIDFYGRFQAGAVGGDRVGYVDPPFVSATTADTICILRGAPNMKTAQQFVRWLLSKQAQRLWQQRVGLPDGPVKDQLRRMPIRRDLYTPEEMALWVDKVNPFELARPKPPGTPSYFDAVSPVSQAIAINIHDDLVAAWSVILHATDHPRYKEMVELFDAMPPDLTLTWPDADLAVNWQAIINDPTHERNAEVQAVLKAFGTRIKTMMRNEDMRQLNADRLRWTLFFRENYRRIVAIAASQ